MVLIEGDPGSLGEVRGVMRASQDPRATRTRQAIFDAVEVLDARTGTAVTVSAIVRAAGISRGSFYTHFADIDELAVTLLGYAFDEIGREDLARRQQVGVTGAEVARAALGHLVFHLHDHRSLYVAIFGLPATSQAFFQAVELCAFHMRQTFALLPNIPPLLDTEATATYVAGGTLTILSTWLRSREPSPPGDVVDLLFGLLPPWLAEPE